MAIQFPKGPFIGNTFPYDDMVYVWDGEKWTAQNDKAYWDKNGNELNPEDTGNDVNLGPGDLSANDGSFSGDLAVAGDVTTDLNVLGDVTATSANGGPLAGFRNQIINGDFKFWARGTAVSVPDTLAYTADRWAGITPNAAGTSEIARSVNAPYVEGLTWSATNTGSVLVAFQQAIELYNQNNCQFTIGSQWTLSFWTTEDQTANSANVKFKAGTTDNGSSASDSLPLYQATGKTSNGYTQYSATFTITTDTSTVVNCNCLSVIFNLNPGQSISGVQLEPGPVVTPFEIRPLAIDSSLCFRYYYAYEPSMALYAFFYAHNMSTNSTSRLVQHPHRVPMRATPTVTYIPDGFDAPPSSQTNYAYLYIYGTVANPQGGAYIKTITADAEL